MLYWFLLLFLYGYFITIRYLLPKIYLNLFLRKELIRELKLKKNKYKNEELYLVLKKFENNIKLIDKNNKYFFTKLHIIKEKQKVISLFYINNRVLNLIEHEQI